MYTQVLLKRGAETQVVWVPSEFAVVGKYLRLRGDDGWRVEEAYASVDRVNEGEENAWRIVKEGQYLPGQCGVCWCCM